MNIFNRMIPWFIPIKDDQNKWYSEELYYNPKEIASLLSEFSSLSKEYNQKLGDFESALTEDHELYKFYIEIRSLAQKVNFLWNRIEYKNVRSEQLKDMLSKLD